LLVKSDGRWRGTDEGQKFVTLPDYELKRLMRSRYRKWRWSHQKVKTAGIATAVDETPPLDTSVLFEDAKEKAREEIDTYLDTLSGYEFQNLVAALLEGMGYATSTVSKPGLDGGTDILAYIDPLGAQTPHIRVQAGNWPVCFFRRLLTGGASRSRPWRRSHRTGRPRPFS
jgi:restriction system protein